VLGGGTADRGGGFWYSEHCRLLATR
jgi:hypothetical protein